MWLPQRQQGLRSSGKSSQSLKSCGLIYNPGEHLQDFLRLPHLSGPWSQHLMKMGLRESSQAGGAVGCSEASSPLVGRVAALTSSVHLMCLG